MDKYHTVNTVVGGDIWAEVFYTLKERMKDAGWVVKASSDGTTYNSTGDQITSGGTAANGLNRSSAWFRIQEPGGRREFTFQRGASATAWRVKYSANAKFTGGSPAATVTASATDEQIWVGSGTDASPTYSTTTFTGTSGAFKYHIVTQSTATNGAYYWYVMSSIYPGTGARYLFGMDAIAANTHPSEDADPAVLILTTNAEVSGGAHFLGAVWRYWISYGTGSQVWRNSHCTVYSTIWGAGSQTIDETRVEDRMVPYPGASKDAKIPFAVAYRSAANTADVSFKGFCATLKIRGVNTRAWPTTVDLSTDAYVYFGAFLVPWPESVTPSVL